MTVQSVDAIHGRGRMERQVLGFMPRLAVGIRPTLSGLHAEQGVQTMMRTVDCLLRHTHGDLGFSVECERVLLMRRNGAVYVRDTFTDHLNIERLELITLPFQTKALRP